MSENFFLDKIRTLCFTCACMFGVNSQAQESKGLKDYFQGFFPIGVSVSPQSLKGGEAMLILKQFNSLTAENVMKPQPIHPEERRYHWAPADKIVDFAQANGLRMRGHTLCWYNQTPDWFFKSESGDQVTKEALLQRLKDHITSVVTRYKGKVYAWDVVNEVISDEPGEYFRKTKWFEICGEEFVARAFQYAHEADPTALLFYNDYNEIDSTKREKIIKMVQGLQKAGVPIHGVGLQGHWAINEPTRSQLDKTLKRFSDLKLKLQITELDISVYPKEHHPRERKPGDNDAAFTPEREKKQIEVYKMCFELFRKYNGSISGVTFWNVSDRHSWLDSFPVKDRKDYPLLFDQNLKPKKVYAEVVNF